MKTKLKIESYDDCITELVRIRDEVEQVSNHIYSYETQEDTVKSEVADQASCIAQRIDDDLGELYSIVNNQR